MSKIVKSFFKGVKSISPLHNRHLWKFLTVLTLSVLVIVFMWFAFLAPRGMNLGFAICDLEVYDSQDNIINPQEQKFLFMPQDLQIGGIGLQADVQIMEKVPNTVGALKADLQLDVSWVVYQWEGQDPINKSFINPLIWTVFSVDWSDHINEKFHYSSGKIFTADQLESEINAALGGVLVDPEGYRAFEGMWFQCGISILLVVHPFDLDGRPLEAAVSKGSGFLEVKWSKVSGDPYIPPNEPGVIINSFTGIQISYHNIAMADTDNLAIYGGF